MTAPTDGGRRCLRGGEADPSTTAARRSPSPILGEEWGERGLLVVFVHGGGDGAGGVAGTLDDGFDGAVGATGSGDGDGGVTTAGSGDFAPAVGNRLALTVGIHTFLVSHGAAVGGGGSVSGASSMLSTIPDSPGPRPGRWPWFIREMGVGMSVVPRV